MERVGESRSVAMKITGHKTESAYRRYAIADVASIEEGFSKLASLIPANTAKEA
jgi:hypothetical protein